MTAIPKQNGIGTALVERIRSVAHLPVIDASHFGHGTRGNRLPTLLMNGYVEWAEEGQSVQLTAKGKELAR